MDISNIKYAKIRDWIKQSRKRGLSWDKIELLNQSSIEEFLSKLNVNKIEQYWDIDIETWHLIVNDEKIAEMESLTAEIIGVPTIVAEDPQNYLDLPLSNDENSLWNLYSNKLREKKFKERTIRNIEESSRSILVQLKDKTEEDKPVKGLVVGNVQSGKTANMAALIAMAADIGFNFFVVLSGTIDKLREQTQDRLYGDLDLNSNLQIQLLTNLSSKTASPFRLQDLKFEKKSKKRYLYVCLKNQAVLKNLNQWINKDQLSKEGIKLLVIDDEADQAGINTLDIDSDERTKINKLIIDLVANRNYKSEKQPKSFGAVNYIGYTATPYANILNEAKPESLYPSSFIATLAVSDEYFGPQQIFGLDDSNLLGLSIVNKIDINDVKLIKKDDPNFDSELPQSFKESVMWFYCSVAALRLSGYKKPLSMLIHTSQKQKDHSDIYHRLKEWIKKESNRIDDFIFKMKKVWDQQTKQFNKSYLRLQYPKYGVLDKEINDYPNFDDFKIELKFLIDQQPCNIELDYDNDKLVYTTGMHLCIDNCKYNGVDFNGRHFRLAYPDPKNCSITAPAFIVIGGSTLSRGLTLEGLVSTYFLRTTKQADTLMQMGRWFGYRHNYELYPRVWLTDNAIIQFKYLSNLDFKLRNELSFMEKMGLSPLDYAPRVIFDPDLAIIQITSKNRMQGVEEVDADFSGYQAQTTVFYKDIRTLEKNIQSTESFIKTLGNPILNNPVNIHAKDAFIWKNVDHTKVFEYLSNMKYPDHIKLMKGYEGIKEWYIEAKKQDLVQNWNVAISGIQSGKETYISGLKVKKVNRSKVKNSNPDEISIGVLRDSKDILLDIDLDQNPDLINVFKDDSISPLVIREKSCVSKMPQLLIYVIDRDSKAIKKDSQVRLDLNSSVDVIGIFLLLPRISSSNKDQYVRVKIIPNIDFEGVDEDA